MKGYGSCTTAAEYTNHMIELFITSCVTIENCPGYLSVGPITRSSTSTDVDLYLQRKWEECINGNVELSALLVRHYTSEGEFSQMVH